MAISNGKTASSLYYNGPLTKIMDVSKTIVIYYWHVHSTKWVHEPFWISKVKVIHWPSSRVTQIQHFQTSFAQKPLSRLKPNFIWSFHAIWKMKICSNVPGHMTMPIFGEKLQQSSSSEQYRDQWLWNLVYIIGHSSTSNVLIWWPLIDLDHFYDRVKLVSECFCMVESFYSIVLMYFQVCSNSAYPQHSGERYRTNGPLV